MESEPMLTSSDTASCRTASPTHYRRSYSGPWALSAILLTLQSSKAADMVKCDLHNQSSGKICRRSTPDDPVCGLTGERECSKPKGHINRRRIVLCSLSATSSCRFFWSILFFFFSNFKCKWREGGGVHLAIQNFHKPSIPLVLYTSSKN